MSKRGLRLIIFAAIAILLASAGYVVLCGIQNPAGAETGSSGADNIQLLYFHRTQRCVSCNNAEAYARETLDRYFAPEMAAGKLSIQSIDYQTDKATADKYNVKMQGLKLLITHDGRQTVKDVPEVWALVRDKEACISCLRDVLNKELGK